MQSYKAYRMLQALREILPLRYLAQYLVQSKHSANSSGDYCFVRGPLSQGSEEARGQWEKGRRGSKKREKKMQSTSWDPYGAVQAHSSLAANLPPPEMSAAPLTLVWSISVSGQVGARDIDWYQSKCSEHPRAVQREAQQEAGRGGVTGKCSFLI